MAGNDLIKWLLPQIIMTDTCRSYNTFHRMSATDEYHDEEGM
jgi:hypothetical protein